jgi:hypothetical protein
MFLRFKKQLVEAWMTAVSEHAAQFAHKTSLLRFDGQFLPSCLGRAGSVNNRSPWL